MTIGKNNAINNRIPNTTDAGKVLKSTSTGGVVEWGEVSITVDQTYDATSTNAQSGTAVAGAISGKFDASKVKNAYDATAGNVYDVGYVNTQVSQLAGQMEFIGEMTSVATTEAALVTELEAFVQTKQSRAARKGDVVNVSGGSYDKQQWYCQAANTWVKFTDLKNPEGTVAYSAEAQTVPATPEDVHSARTLHKVSKTGSYNDLGDKPTLGTAAAKAFTTELTSGSTDLVTSGAVYSAIVDALNDSY